MKNRIQLIKKLLSFGLRNEGFRWVGIKMEILNFRLFSLQLFLAKTYETLSYLSAEWKTKGRTLLVNFKRCHNNVPGHCILVTNCGKGGSRR